MAHTTLRKSAGNPIEMPVLHGPKAATVKAILSYSKALKIVEVPPIGQVDLVLN